MPETHVKVIADSISESGHRITSIECHYPRFIHAEMLRHGLLHARSVSSSRAIPTQLLMQKVMDDPVVPIEFGQNQSGMVSNSTLDEKAQTLSRQIWMDAAKNAAMCAQRLWYNNVHKQHVNRILEPFIQVHELITATSWQNFLTLRLADDAQPEIQQLAQCIKNALDYSVPKMVTYGGGYKQWHLPYITDDIQAIVKPEAWCDISAALCARLSYSTYSHEQRMQESRDSLGDDEWMNRQIELAKQLYHARHLTPFEHQALPSRIGWHDQFLGWQSLRNILRGDLEKR